ncbi:HAD-IA family hydrolase [Gymnodinialimonas sp. 2305UL16-5]|uniref:HAD family hydrolase n=1 Tax=Gymnodinialimonas mytili TaxID=3126503 RepID=UPI0030AC7AA6
MRPDLVIFDCDGVLVDSEPLSSEVIAKSLSRHGLPMTTQQAMTHFVGGTMEDDMRKAIEMGASLPGDWLTQINAEILARLERDVQAVSGVLSVLDVLDRADIRYCVASNGSDRKMGVTLGKTGIAPRVEGRLFSAYTYGVAKPDPELFLIAASTMGATPERSVVIEDSATGALAANRAKMRCFGYAPNGDGAALAEKGAKVFQSMDDLPKLLDLDA